MATAHQAPALRCGLPEEVHRGIAQGTPVRGRESAGLLLLRIEVHQHEGMIQAFRRGSVEGQHRGIVAADAPHFGAIEEAGMVRDQAIQGRQIIDQIRFRSPGEVPGLVDVHSLRGQPFHSGGEAESTALAHEGAETVAQEGPGRAADREAQVVVGFAVVDQEARPFPLSQAIVQVVGDFDGVVILEQLGVGPLHATPSEQGFGGLPGTPEALQQEDGLRIGPMDLCGDVLPCRNGHHVARIAAEAIHAPAAPDEQGPGHGIPEGRAALVQFHQVGPGVAPGAGTVEGSIRVPAKPLRSVLQQTGTPARVVHEDVQEDLPVPLVDRFGQLPELLLRRGAPVEVHQGRIDGGEVQLGVGAAEAAHAGEGGGHWPHGKQMQDAAAEPIHDVGHDRREIPQASRGGDDRIPRGVQGMDGLGKVGPLMGGRASEHAGEGAIDRVRGAQAVRMDGKGEVVSFRPVLEPVRVHAIGFGPEEPRLGERQVQYPLAIGPMQRDVPPGRSRRIAGTLPQQGQDLVAHPRPAGEIRAQEGLPTGGIRLRVCQAERHPIPHEAEQLGARRRRHREGRHGGASASGISEVGTYSMGSRP